MFPVSSRIQQVISTGYVLAFLLFSSNTQAQITKTSVLFTGNSYTYYWNMPLIVQEMTKSQGDHFIITSETAGGVSWKQHMEDEAGLNTRRIISNGEWDFVVLQNNSLGAINAPDDFVTYGKQLIALIQKNGSTALLFETWARENRSSMQQTITREYESLGSNTGANTVPVGQMWKIIRDKRPGIALYDSDGSHPSPIGSYVTACMFYATLTGKSCGRLPTQIHTTRKDGKTPYLLKVAAEDADFIKKMVDEFLELDE